MAYALIAMAALKAASSYFASENVKETAKLNRDITEMNAQFAELDAYDAKIAGMTQKAKYQSVIDQIKSEQRAVLAASDVDVTYGTAAEISKETDFIGELNLMEIQKRAEEQALGYSRQAREYRFKGALGYAEAESQASQILVEGGLDVAKYGLSGYKEYATSKENT